MPPRSSSSLSSSFFSFSFPSRPTAAPFACFRGVFGSSSSSSCFSILRASLLCYGSVRPLFFVLLLFAFIRCSLNLFIFCCCASESWEKPETSDSRSSSSSSSCRSRSSLGRRPSSVSSCSSVFRVLPSATGDAADAARRRRCCFFVAGLDFQPTQSFPLIVRSVVFSPIRYGAALLIVKPVKLFGRKARMFSCDCLR